VLSYACPVHLEGAGVLYSIGLVGLSQRLGDHPQGEVVAALRGAAEALSKSLPSGLHQPVIGEVPAVADERNG